MKNNSRVRGKQQRGIALLTALFALLLISGIAVGMMYLANTETAINYNYRDQQKADYAAYAGVQEVRARMMSGVANQITALPTALPSSSGGIVYVRNPRGSETINPTDSTNAYFDTELCHEGFPGLTLTDTGANVPCASTAPSAAVSYIASTSPDTGTSSAMAYKWVRITWKNNKSSGGDTNNAWLVTGQSGTATTIPICWDGNHEVTLPTDGRANCDASPVSPNTTYTRQVYMLTSLAVTPTGARKMMQVEAALNPPFITNAAVDTNDFVTVSGSSVTVNGYDNCQCDCTNPKGGGAPTCTFRVGGAACTGTTNAIFTSQAVSTSGSPAMVAGTSPVNAEHQAWPYDVNSLVQAYSTAAGTINVTGAPYNQTCSGSPANCGTFSGTAFGTVPTTMPPNTDNPARVDQVTYIPGDVDLQAHCTGSGVLIVNGNLTIHGGIDFYGLILVSGSVTFSGGGSGQANNVTGAVIAGSSTSTDTLAGSVNLQFDSCALLHNQIAAPPKNLGIHALAY